MSENSTIAAVSTPIGEGGISVIRISGNDAIAVADKCFRSFSGEKLCSLSGYSALYGQITDGNQILDDAVALVFCEPKSYTGENVVELSVHAGPAITKAVLRRVLDCGATLAARGEFTKRAFLNGKLDLAKAESIMGLITAESDAALRISRAAKSGKISTAIQQITDNLIETAASFAAYSDYPDEDIEGLSKENFTLLLENCSKKLCELTEDYDIGKLIRNGIDCVIAGKPNVGKSTLMNLLCKSEKSIVTDIAGTTRDVIENTVRLGELTLNLSDTAGIRQGSDEVERVGVDRAVERLKNAALVLAVFDTSRPLDGDDLDIIKMLSADNTLAVLNKNDLDTVADTTPLKDFKTVTISAKSGEGAKALEDAIAEITRINKLSADDTVLISERQRDCARRAQKAVDDALNAYNSGVTLDAVGICVDDAISALLELTGKRVTNEVTDEVFRRFCVGK